MKRFILRYSYVHHADTGHNVKTRATRNDILYNRITDEDDGRSSYNIDISNGGRSYIIGNVIQQSSRTENSTLVSYGAEGMEGRRNELYFVNNTVVNDRHAGNFLLVHDGKVRRAKLINNLFVGTASFSQAAGWKIRNNLVTTKKVEFVNPDDFDYRLRDSSSAVNAGVNPGSGGGVSLRPRRQYEHPADSTLRQRVGKLDLGAFERF